jgi:hypothetical protein
MTLASTAYEANLYPATPSSAASTPVVGVCFSGGGSRALTCALGQLSALNGLPSPTAPGRTLLDDVRYISSVSGGSWAAVTYTFLPPTISDTDFLIAPAAPAALTSAPVSTMNPHCLGSVPQNFAIPSVADLLYHFWHWGLFSPVRSRHAELVLDRCCGRARAEAVRVDDIVDELVKKYLLPSWATTVLEHLLQALVDSKAAEVLPAYNYWPLGEVSQPSPQNKAFGFSDGGTFDNSGILGLLAQTDVNRIVAFINTETPLWKAAGVVVVDDSIPLLFGSAYPATGDGPYVSFGGMKPSLPMSYVQVFDNTHGELDALCQDSTTQAAAARTRTPVGTHPACFSQTLATVANPVANILGGRQVKVVWIYNNRVNAWQKQITDPTLLAALASGQANENQDGTFITGKSGTGPLASFPHYNTVKQIYLAPEAVNMLAQLSAWNVQQVQPQIASLLYAGG